MADHAVVGPNRLALHMPGALEDLDGLGHGEGGGRQRLPQLGHLSHGGDVGDEDSARAQRGLGVLDHPPGLGEVEHGAVEIGLVDALVGAALLDRVGHVGPEEGAHVLLGPRREVRPHLVADHLGARSQQRHRHRARAHARLEHPGAGKHVRQHQQRSQVLRVHDLGAPRHLEHEVGKGRAHDCVAGTGPRAHGRPFDLADDGVVGRDAGVGVELGALDQRHQVAPGLGVDEQHPLSRLEEPAHVAARSTRRQKAQMSPGVGVPQRAQERSPSCSARASGVNRCDARSRNPK